jgi:hypothetical protein
MLPAVVELTDLYHYTQLLLVEMGPHQKKEKRLRNDYKKVFPDFSVHFLKT